MSFPYLKDLLYWLTGFEVPLTQFIPMFGLCVAVSSMVWLWIYSFELKRLKKTGVIKLSEEPSEFAQNLLLVTLFSGILGAKVFFILEYPKEFFQDPIGMIFSRGGWTIFGGLFFGIVMGAFYVKKRGQSAKVLLDLSAPILFLCYGIGRVGCHLSGDGDWGIPANLDIKPDWVPDWFWSSYYTNNILGQQLEAPVYPTPLYETLASFLIFIFLWCIRKHKFQAGWLTSVYLLLVGVERFLIEQIRINVKYNLGWFQATQAELVSVVLIVLGGIGVVKFMGKKEFLPEAVLSTKKKK